MELIQNEPIVEYLSEIDALQETNCLYLSLTFLQNPVVNVNGNPSQQDLVAVLKFGCCNVSCVEDRIKKQDFELGSVYSKLLFVSQGGNVILLESMIKKALSCYKLKIQCYNNKRSFPKELFAVNKNVVNIIYDVIQNYKDHKIIFNEFNKLNDNHFFKKTIYYQLSQVKFKYKYYVITSTKYNLTQHQIYYYNNYDKW